jgi:hypothetical protein
VVELTIAQKKESEMEEGVVIEVGQEEFVRKE